MSPSVGPNEPNIPIPQHRGADEANSRRLESAVRGALDLVRSGANVAMGATSGGMVGDVGPGLQALFGGQDTSIAGGLGADGTGQFGNFEAIMKLQLQVQAMMQSQTMRSNIAKTAHDAQMNSVRNIKA
ncbi:MAG: hypothetical protein H6832_02925 [Planctomycetes bacterium]|nr:hypothetical protein [Planctomycetota bacterium]